MPASIFAGSKVKTLKGTLSLNGGADVISSTTDPTSVAVDASPGSILLNTTSGKQYRKNDSGSSTNWTEVGAGTSGINYIANPSASTNTTGWSTYADAAGAQPVDGTGGSPTVTWTRSTTTPLRGAADFNFTKDAANRQGEGVATDITIDLADRAKVLTVTFDYEVLSGTYASGDLTVYLIADPTGTPVVIQPAGYTVQSATVGTTMRQTATFQTQATGQSYRVCFHVASTSAAAYVVAVDNVICGPQSTVQGAAISDWVSSTPTYSNAGTTSLSVHSTRRVGDTLQIQGRSVFATAGAAAVLRLRIPSSIGTIDTTKVQTGNLAGTVGSYNAQIGGSIFNGNVNLTTTANEVSFIPDGPGGAHLGSAFGLNTELTYTLSVPISGWSSNTVLSQDTDTRVVAASFSVTGSHTSSGSFQAIPSLTVRGDTHGMISGTTVTIPVSGWYDFSGNIGFLSNAIGIRDVQIAFSPLPSGVPFSPTTQFSSPQTGLSGGQTHVGVGGAVYLNAGTQITFLAYQNSGGSLAYGDTLLTVKRLSGPATIAASETVAFSASRTAGDYSSDTDITWNNKFVDTHNSYSGTIYTIPVSGVYDITASLSISINVSPDVTRLSIIKNLFTIKDTWLQPVAASNGTIWPMNVQHIGRFIAGDQIKINISSDTTTWNTAGMTGLSNNFTIKRVGL